jgi:hypothetical protein
MDGGVQPRHGDGDDVVLDDCSFSWTEKTQHDDDEDGEEGGDDRPTAALVASAASVSSVDGDTPKTPTEFRICVRHVSLTLRHGELVMVVGPIGW